MVLLFAVAVLIQQPEPQKAFELLDEQSPKAKIAVSVVSRDGTTALAHDFRNWFIYKDGSREDLKGIVYDSFMAKGIRPDGLIVGNRVKAANVALYRDGATRILGEPGQWWVSSGIAADGLARIWVPVIGPTEDSGWQSYNVAVADGDPSEIIRDVDVGPVVESTEHGFLGHWYFSRYWKNSRVKPMFAAYIQGRTARRFEVPATATNSRVISWSDDGLTVFGEYVEGGSRMVPLIWRDGTILKSLGARVWLTAFTKDGKLAVGHRGDQLHADLAVVWREKEGLQSLAEYAKEKKVQIPEGWTLTDAVGVTPSRGMITGTAKSKDYKVRPFRMRIEAPKPLPADG